jgi:thiol-disulfide isomerase/thioredoxin
MRALLTLTLSLVPLPLAADLPARVQLDAISYTDLAAELKGLQGKVVLVDVWGTFCAPCRDKFPRVVAMHAEHARRGLAVVSVSVDPPDDPAARTAAREFLSAQKATFRNVILTDKAEVWQAKWKIDGPPLLFLFDRTGRLVQRWDEKVDLTEVEKRVASLVAE